MVKIALDAGHGINTAGKRTPDGEREWTFNNKVLLATAARLKSYDNVEVLRLDDSSGNFDIPLKERTNKANAWGADVLVSIHHNAHMGVWGSHGGVETYRQPGSSKASVTIAEILQSKIVGAMGLRDRGVKTANLHMTREANMPAVLTEGGFMDSLSDILVMRNDAKLKAQGEAIAEGLASYFKLKPVKEVEQVSKPKPVVNPTVKPAVNPKPSTTTSIVDWMNINKMDSSFANRAKLAKHHGFRDYKGTADQNIALLSILQNSKPVSKPSTVDVKTNSIVDWLNANKMDSSFSNRAKLARKLGIKNYRGTAAQNIALLSKLRK